MFNRISSAVVQMGKGKDDGSRDKVKVKVCSDVNPSDCCENQLTRLTSNGWGAGKVETWSLDKFGKCGERLFKVGHSINSSNL